VSPPQGNKNVLLLPEFCPGGQRPRLTLNKSTLLVYNDSKKASKPIKSPQLVPGPCIQQNSLFVAAGSAFLDTEQAAHANFSDFLLFPRQKCGKKEELMLISRLHGDMLAIRSNKSVPGAHLIGGEGWSASQSVSTRTKFGDQQYTADLGHVFAFSVVLEQGQTSARNSAGTFRLKAHSRLLAPHVRALWLSCENRLRYPQIEHAWPRRASPSSSVASDDPSSEAAAPPEFSAGLERDGTDPAARPVSAAPSSAGQAQTGQISSPDDMVWCVNQAISGRVDDSGGGGSGLGRGQRNDGGAIPTARRRRRHTN